MVKLMKIIESDLYTGVNQKVIFVACETSTEVRSLRKLVQIYVGIMQSDA